MGEAYLAQDTRLDRKVALKILPADLAANEDRMRRFVLEAKAAAALNHPNIELTHRHANVPPATRKSGNVCTVIPACTLIFLQSFL